MIYGNIAAYYSQKSKKPVSSRTIYTYLEKLHKAYIAKPDDFTEEELTFYWSDEEYKEFLEELKEYTTAL